MLDYPPIIGYKSLYDGRTTDDGPGDWLMIRGGTRRGRSKSSAPETPPDGGGTQGNETGGRDNNLPPVSLGSTNEVETQDGLTPLDVILQTMQHRWRQGDRDGAATLARAAAPYVHLKASMARDDGVAPIQGMSDAELELIVRAGKGDGGGCGVADAKVDPQVAEELGD